MLNNQIDLCKNRISEEEKLALLAPSPDAALAHSQAAMVARVELSILQRERAAQAEVPEVASAEAAHLRAG